MLTHKKKKKDISVITTGVYFSFNHQGKQIPLPVQQELCGHPNPAATWRQILGGTVHRNKRHRHAPARTAPDRNPEIYHPL